MLQDPTQDPYGSIKKSEQEQQDRAPGQSDIVSGIFPGMKAGQTPNLVKPNGQVLETPSGAERREARQQAKRMKQAQFKFHIQTYTQYCEDDQIRMMFRLINENVGTGFKTVLVEYGYDKGKLQNFINAIEDHEAEIKKAKLEAGGAEAPPEA